LTKSIAIFPYCARLRDGSVSPKEYPYWEELVALLIKEFNYSVIQFSAKGFPKIKNVELLLEDYAHNEIVDACKVLDFYLSCDSFAPHLLNFYNIKGLIIFAVSDPKIYGYTLNVNVSKGSEFYKHNQFGDWRAEDRKLEAFLKPQEIINILKQTTLVNGYSTN
jgi:ADP-heptose:LPS heptosyltransferase